MLLHFDCKRNLFTFFHTFLGHNFDYLFEIKIRKKNQANGRLRVVLQIPKAIELTPIYDNQFKIKVFESKYLENECLHYT